MKTYQDLQKATSEEERMHFVLKAIAEFRDTDMYRVAEDAELYYKHLNPTIMRAQKMIYNMAGQAVPDIWSANNKIPCRYYFYFITQLVQFLLGNGVSFSDVKTKDKLGKSFDYVIQRLATYALNDGVAFGYWNLDHLEVFPIAGGKDQPSFVPLYDEENGGLRAGVRYWQVSSDKPLRATLYEEDGYTDYIKRKNEDMAVLQPKRDYKQVIQQSITSTEILNGGNYPGFPIIPLFNANRQSELVGGKEALDAYDLMASALVNNVDEGNLIYWVLKNCSGMDDIDDAKFLDRLKTVHVAHADGDDGAGIEAHTIEAPFDANEVALKRLRSQLFDDFMALDVKEIAGGAATATQIKAAYEPLNNKTDLFEYEVTSFIDNLLALIGIEDEPTYTRSIIVNQQEMVQVVLSAASNLPDDYVTQKLLEILGDADKLEDILAQIKEEDMSRFPMTGEENGFGAQGSGQEAGGDGEETL